MPISLSLNTGGTQTSGLYGTYDAEATFLFGEQTATSTASASSAATSPASSSSMTTWLLVAAAAVLGFFLLNK